MSMEKEFYLRTAIGLQDGPQRIGSKQLVGNVKNSNNLIEKDFWVKKACTISLGWDRFRFTNDVIRQIIQKKVEFEFALNSPFIDVGYRLYNTPNRYIILVVFSNFCLL